MSKIKHVLFDNDGTIVDSEIIAVRIMLRMLKPFGLDMSEREYSHRFPGLRERDIMAILKQEYGIVPPEDFLPQLRDEHIRLFERELRAVPGMVRFFKTLKTPKSMVSNGSVQHVVRSLRRVRLHHALDGQIFSAEHVERPKPHPDIYEYALRQLGLRPDETVVVEDSVTGVLAAKQAGLFVVGFLGATHIFDGHEEKLRQGGADVVAAEANELKRIFQTLDVF